MANSLVNNNNKPKFQMFIKSEAVLKNISTTLGDVSRSKKFVASLISAVGTNKALEECEGATIVSGALLGESLNLSPSPQLGHYYLTPFKDNKAHIVNAVFVLGYKGYIQLAIRSGQYKKINVLAIKQGELIKYDPMLEEIEVKLIEDEIERDKAETIGYYAMFELVNGFRKTMYWSKEKMLAHADKYSKAFSLEKYKEIKAGKIKQEDMWRYSSFWYKDFDSMGFKTMLRQLISKWGIMSIEMQEAYTNDMSFKDEKGGNVYVDNDLETDFNQVIDVPVNQETGEVVQEQPSLL